MKKQILMAVMGIAMLYALPVRAFEPKSGLMPIDNSIVYIENKGQLSTTEGKPCPEVTYYGSSSGVGFYLRKTGISYVFSDVGRHPVLTKNDLEKGKKQERLSLYRLDLDLINANPEPEAMTSEPIDSYFNYYKENCPNGIVGVKGFRQVIYKNVYPAIDMKVYVSREKMKYDFIVHPGGNVNDIKFKVRGAESTILNNGRLVLSTPLGVLTEDVPVTYQEGKIVNSGFVLNNDIVSFHLDAYDISKDLVIDPTRQWSTYYGGSVGEDGWTLTSDASGNIFIGGTTTSYDFPYTIGSGFAGAVDAYLVKFNAYGVRQWATYYGGSDMEDIFALGTDGNGNVYGTGVTLSTDFPTLSFGSAYYDNTHNGLYDAFVIKLNTAGATQYATFFGGNGDDRGSAIEVYGNSDIILVGQTYSSAGMPITTLTGAFNDNTLNGTSDGFIAKIPQNAGLQWCTYYGGTGNDNIAGLDVDDGNGNIFVCGRTEGGFPTLSFANAYNQSTFGGSSDAFISKFNINGVQQWSTYYGDTGGDHANSIDVDGQGYITVVGGGDTGFPLISGLPCGASSSNSAPGGFILKFKPNCSRYWTNLYPEVTTLHDVSVDGNGTVYCIGETQSTSFACTSNAYDNTSVGGDEPVIIKYSSNGGLLWATYYGSNSNDIGYGIVKTAAGIYVIGTTYGANYFYQSYTPPSGTSYVQTFNNFSSGTTAFVSWFTDDTTFNVAGSDVSICPGSSATVSVSLSGGTAPYSYSWTPATGLACTTCSSTTASPTVTTTYTVTVNDAAGNCGGHTITVTVLSGPTANAGADKQICPNTCVSIGPSSFPIPGFTYSWSPATGLNSSTVKNPIACPTVTTTYTLTVTGSNGCTSTDQATVSVYNLFANAGPDISGCCGTITFIGNGSSTATGGTAPYTYSWSPSTGLNSTTIANPQVTYCPLTMGGNTYTLTVTDAMGCTATDVVVLTRTCRMANPDDSSYINASIYPNPGTGIYTIDLGEDESMTVRITDARGRVIFNRMVTEKTFTFDMSSEPKGIYIIYFEGRHSQVKKLILQ